MENKELYEAITLGLILFAVITDFTIFITILVAFIIMNVFIIPFMDFSEEYTRAIRGGEFSDETVWKIMTLIAMFFSLVTILHNPMKLLLDR